MTLILAFKKLCNKKYNSRGNTLINRGYLVTKITARIHSITKIRAKIHNGEDNSRRGRRQRE